MSGKEIVNEGFEFSVNQMGVNKPGITKGNQSNVIVEKSLTSQASKKAILTTKITQTNAALNWQCEGPTKMTTAISEIFVGGAFNIMSSAVKTKVDGKPCVLNGDFIICNCTCTAPQKGSPPPPPVITPGICKIEIINAGQNKLKGL